MDFDDENWLADNLVKLLGWGTGAFIVVCGWLMGTNLRFDFNGTPRESERALLLCGLTIVAFTCWTSFTLWVRVKRLGDTDSPRVLPWPLVAVYCVAISITASALTIYASLD